MLELKNLFIATVITVLVVQVFSSTLKGARNNVIQTAKQV